jgi:4'-phosphopantetheinyl transferase
LDFSLSYEEGEAWIVLSRGGRIGVDVILLEPVPEAEAIAQTYFDPADRSALRESTDPVRDFALAWTQLEARCKCLKQGLTEWSESLALDTKACTTESLIIQDKLALSVATVP